MPNDPNEDDVLDDQTQQNEPIGQEEDDLGLDDLDLGEDDPNGLEGGLPGYQEPVTQTHSGRDRSSNARIRELIAEKKRTEDLLQQMIQAQSSSRMQPNPMDDDLTPEERRIQALERQVAQNSALSWDRADKADFRALQAINPTARKLASEVEQEVVKLRQQGMNLPREEVFAWVLGKKMMANPPKSRTGSTKPTQGGQRQVAVSGTTQSRKGGPKNASEMTAAEFEAQFGSVPL